MDPLGAQEGIHGVLLPSLMAPLSRTGLILTLLLASGGGVLAMATRNQPIPAVKSEISSVAMEKTVLHRGSFRQAEAPVQGTYTIRRDGQRTVLTLSDDFRTNPKAPDLKLAIGQANNPIARSKPPAYPLEQGTYTVIAPLRSASGGDTYVLPASLKLAGQGSVIIWCEQFNATMAWAPLSR